MQENEQNEKIREIVSNILQDKRIELVDMTFRREGRAKILRILVDTEAGITINECAELNREIGEVLDRENIISKRYLLEVSSPGLDRPLKTKSDFLRMKGKRIYVRTFGPIDGKSQFIGELEIVDDEGIIVTSDNVQLAKIPFDKIAKATLDYKSLI